MKMAQTKFTIKEATNMLLYDDFGISQRQMNWKKNVEDLSSSSGESII